MGKSIYEGSFLGKLLGMTTKIINPEKLYRTLTGSSDNGFDDRQIQLSDRLKWNSVFLQLKD